MLKRYGQLQAGESCSKRQGLTGRSAQDKLLRFTDYCCHGMELFGSQVQPVHPRSGIVEEHSFFIE